jgi:hypothetical protein
MWKSTDISTDYSASIFRTKKKLRKSEERNRNLSVVSLFDTEDGGSKFLRHVYGFLPDYTALRLRKMQFSSTFHVKKCLNPPLDIFLSAESVFCAG